MRLWKKYMAKKKASKFLVCFFSPRTYNAICPFFFTFFSWLPPPPHYVTASHPSKIRNTQRIEERGERVRFDEKTERERERERGKNSFHMQVIWSSRAPRRAIFFHIHEFASPLGDRMVQNGWLGKKRISDAFFMAVGVFNEFFKKIYKFWKVFFLKTKNVFSIIENFESPGKIFS